MGERVLEGDLQPARFAADFRQKRLPGRGDVVRGADVRPVHAVQHGGAVAHRAGDDVLHHRPLPDLAEIRTGRHAAARGLEPEKAAVGGRDADRPAAVAPARQRHHAGRHGGRGTAARPARGALGVPGVARGAEEIGLGVGHQPELRRVRLAQDHHPGPLVAADQFAVVVRHEVAQRLRTAGQRHPGIDRQQVLDQKRHPREGPCGQGLREAFPRQIEHGPHHRVDLGVEALDAVDGRLADLHRRDRPGADQLRQTEPVVAIVLLEFSHGRPRR